MKCITLTCAPTNTAVLGVTKRVMSFLRNSFRYDTYGLGDIVLFGSESRMKIDDCEDLVDIFLKFRVKILRDCLAPFSGWNGSCDWMIRLLEDPEAQYQVYLSQNIEVDKKESNIDNDEKDSRGNDERDNCLLYVKKYLIGDCESDSSDDSSNERENEDKYQLYMKEKIKVDGESDIIDEKDDSDHEDKNEESDNSPVKNAMKANNWKAFIVSTLKGNTNDKHHKTVNEQQKSDKNNLEEKISTFEEFVMKGFDSLGGRLISYMENLYTHMPTAVISDEAAKQMVELVRSLRRLGESLKQTIAANVGLKEALYGSDDNLYACRFASLTKLKDIRTTLCSLVAMDDLGIRKLCLSNACLLFCTASSSSSLQTLKTGPLEFLLIDEASQLKECESLIPLHLQGLRHVVLVGDEKQLPAMVQSKVL